MFAAGAYEEVTGGGVALLGRQRLTGQAAAATAGPGRAGVVGVDGNTAGHFTAGDNHWLGGDLGFAVSSVWFRDEHFLPVDLHYGWLDHCSRPQRLPGTANSLDLNP